MGLEIAPFIRIFNEKQIVLKLNVYGTEYIS
jgi:hypothetical protein